MWKVHGVYSAREIGASMAVTIREQIVSASDPGAVGAKFLWVDTSGSPAVLKVRNDTNDAWVDVGVAGSGVTGSGTDGQMTRWDATGITDATNTDAEVAAAVSIALADIREIILFTTSIDLTAIADTDIAVPTGYHFYIDEMGIVCDTIDTMTVQPTISFGITGSTTKHLAAAITTNLTATFKRENYMPLVPDDGETDLNISVTIGATAVAMTGRAYWTGVLVKDP
jgi:hypothetical protein